MKTTEQWLNGKLRGFNEDPKGMLIAELLTTTCVIEQFINSPKSHASKGLLESCMRHNKILLEKIAESEFNKSNKV